jgi:hypothetical protein
MRSLLAGVLAVCVLSAVAVAAGTMSAADRDATMAKAKQSAKESRWSDARQKAERILVEYNDGDRDALTLAGLASCQLGDAAAARRYLAKLSGARQSMIRSICETKGINL